MNPNIDKHIITAAYEQDEAAAEYGAEFRRDVEAFLTREAIDAVVPPGCHELPPVSGFGESLARALSAASGSRQGKSGVS
jgi:hypothetical protein